MKKFILSAILLFLTGCMRLFTTNKDWIKVVYITNKNLAYKLAIQPSDLVIIKDSTITVEDIKKMDSIGIDIVYPEASLVEDSLFLPVYRATNIFILSSTRKASFLQPYMIKNVKGKSIGIISLLSTPSYKGSVSVNKDSLLKASIKKLELVVEDLIFIDTCSYDTLNSLVLKDTSFSLRLYSKPSIRFKNRKVLNED